MAQPNGTNDTKTEYEFRNLQRGKYYEQYREGTNVILLDDDVFEAFPDSESVNNALRLLLRIRKELTGTN